MLNAVIPYDLSLRDAQISAYLSNIEVIIRGHYSRKLIVLPDSYIRLSLGLETFRNLSHLYSRTRI
jgi:hypothetical protein